MRKILFIVNPVAGKGSGVGYIKKIQEFMSTSECEYQLKISNRVGNITDLARSGIEEGFTDIVSVGGDGTLVETLNGIDFSKEVTLGVLPCGTGNDFARVLGMPIDFNESMQVIMDRQIKTIDIGVANDKLFINSCGCGIDSQIVQDAQLVKRRISGPASYLISTIKNLATYRSQKVYIKIDDLEMHRKIILAAICNGKYFGGGMKITPDAEIDDGYLDVCIVNDLSKPKLLALFPSIFRGDHIHIKPTVEMYRAKEITIKNIEGTMITNTDGNITGLTPLYVKLYKEKLSVIFNRPQN